MLAAAGVAQAAPTVAARGDAHVVRSSTPGVTTLWTNGTDQSGVGIVSQKFEKSEKAIDAQGADDFVVPAGKTWTITEVDAPGIYFNGSGPARAEDVIIFNQYKKGGPGSVAAKALMVKGTDNAGSFAIPTKITLTAGTYWISVRARMAFSKGGEWGWYTTATSQQGSAADWRNPPGGFGIGCTNWSNMQTCIGAAGEGPDFLFTLKGTSK